MFGKRTSSFVQCDLSSQDSIRRAANEILHFCPEIHYLINCAGININERKINQDGFEFNWAVNHLGPFLLTHLLLDRIKSTGKARIVHLSSATSRMAHMRMDDLQLTKGWSLFKSYAQAKLAMNMCTQYLAKELKGTGVTVNALNPGFIKSNLLREAKGFNAIIGIPYMFFCASKTEVGAERIVRVALSDEYENKTGNYIHEDKIMTSNKETLDENLVKRVWDISMKHVGL
jgi:NAD(P)-dependent dehydrogenase (short-subunit alcohol dehydrogenase family)